jgi:hypothetical protein
MDCKVLDYFETSGGDLFIIEFPKPPFLPKFDSKLKYLDYTFQIIYLSIESHKYYNRLGILF